MTVTGRSFRLLFSFAVLAVACWLTLPVQAQDTGAKTYKAKCAACHGADGAGTSAGKAMKARDFCSDDVKKETAAEMTDTIVKGKNKMPSYDKKLSDAEVKDVVAYLKGLCKK